MAAYTFKLAGPVVRSIECGEVPMHIVDALITLLDGDLGDAPKRVGKPLDVPFQGRWSARVGPDWRVVYSIDDRRAVITVRALKPRPDAYYFAG